MRKKDLKAARISGMLENACPNDITQAAIESFSPVKKFVGFSGGNDSLATAHFSMENIPDCGIFHIVTGIGLKLVEEYVRDVCKKYYWPLTIIRAKEDCGQDYRQLVLAHGFPGPAHHYKMFQRLKERAALKLLRDNKSNTSDNVMLATGIRQDESKRRGGYKYSVIDFTGNLMWVNPLYYKSKIWFLNYIAEHKLPQNPASKIMGMSGECLCGAFAEKGELELIRRVEPETADYIQSLEVEVRQAGHNWGWEDKPPKKRCTKTGDMFMPFCVGCERKSGNADKEEIQ